MLGAINFACSLSSRRGLFVYSMMEVPLLYVHQMILKGSAIWSTDKKHNSRDRRNFLEMNRNAGKYFKSFPLSATHDN